MLVLLVFIVLIYCFNCFFIVSDIFDATVHNIIQNYILGRLYLYYRMNQSEELILCFTEEVFQIFSFTFSILQRDQHDLIFLICFHLISIVHIGISCFIRQKEIDSFYYSNSKRVNYDLL